MKKYWDKFRNYCRQNLICIRIYSFLQYRDHWEKLKKFPTDLIMKKNQFIIKLTSTNTLFFLPYYKTDYIQSEIFKTKLYYENSYLRKILFEWNEGIIGKKTANNVVLDIGANIGNHTLFFLKEAMAAKVFCFEPIADTFNILKKNIEINSLTKQAELLNLGVGAEEGKASISHYDSSNIGNTSLTPDAKGKIQIISIDSLDIQDSISLIKIDVEGLEKSVMEGSIQTIKRHRPYIMIEIRNENYEEINCLFRNIGYDGENFFKNWEYGDYLFYPNEMK